MKFVLQLKHWQIFVITFALPFFLYLVAIVVMMATVFANVNSPNPLEAFSLGQFGLLGLVALVWIAALVTTVSWVFNVATGLYRKLPPGNPMKIRRFYFAFFYPMVYAIVVWSVMLVFISQANTMEAKGDAQGFPMFLAYIPFLFIFHFGAIACLFYIIYFIAKSLKSVELQREALAKDYTAEFVLIWFSFIGIWFIQPRINEIFSEGSVES